MYTLTIGTMFKNESDIIKEWLDHHLNRGVDHFWLINDGSVDNYMEVLTSYIEKEQVTLFQSQVPHYTGRQMNIYTDVFLPMLSKTKWLAIMDMDEFLWSTVHKDLKTVLHSFEHLGAIQYNHLLFGSNGHKTQPASVIQSFTKRANTEKCPIGNFKYMVNSSYEFSRLAVHHPVFKHKEDHDTKFLRLDYATSPEWFTLNHYSCMSLDRWKKVKVTRGDADDYLKRTEAMFSFYDTNDVIDTRLADD